LNIINAVSHLFSKYITPLRFQKKKKQSLNQDCADRI